MTAFAEFLNTSFAGFDLAVFEFFYSLHQSAGVVLDPIIKAITALGNHGLLFIIAGLALCVPAKTRKIGIAVLLSLALEALLVNVWLKEAVARTRPYEALEIAKRLWESVGNGPESDLSFPSGHAGAAFASCVALFLAWDNKKLSWLAILFAVIMGVTRLYIGVHYATDVIAGAIVGSAAALAMYYPAKKLAAVIPQRRQAK